MMETVRPVVALALMALLAGCGKQSRIDLASTESEPPPCNPERGQPISEARLKAVLARRGIHLYRDDRCETFRNPNAPAPDPNAIPRNPNAPQATLGNTRNSDDYDRVVSTQGDIYCELYRRDLFGSKLERIKYEGDEETQLRILNVGCAIYPDSPDQIDTFAAALLHLRGAKD
jgi:hypothetical protein